MPTPTYEEAFAGHNDSGYAATNEEPEIFRRMLKGRRFNRVATIASAGEIPYLVMLPLAKEVVAIDHSYRSIVVCFIKAIMLDLMSAEEFRRFMFEATYGQFVDYVRQHVMPRMPQELQDKVGFAPMPIYNVPTLPPGKWQHSHVPWGSKTVGPHRRAMRSETYWHMNANGTRCLMTTVPNPSRAGISVAAAEWTQIRNEWQWVSLQRLRYIKANLHRIKFIHGDVSDLEKQGGNFDALYISNALQHGSRTGAGTDRANKWMSLIRKGGLLLATGSDGQLNAVKKLKKVKEIAGMRTHWLHQIFQLQGAKA